MVSRVFRVLRVYATSRVCMVPRVYVGRRGFVVPRVCVGPPRVYVTPRVFAIKNWYVQVDEGCLLLMKSRGRCDLS